MFCFGFSLWPLSITTTKLSTYITRKDQQLKKLQDCFSLKINFLVNKSLPKRKTIKVGFYRFINLLYTYQHFCYALRLHHFYSFKLSLNNTLPGIGKYVLQSASHPKSFHRKWLFSAVAIVVVIELEYTVGNRQQAQKELGLHQTCLSCVTNFILIVSQKLHEK